MNRRFTAMIMCAALAACADAGDEGAPALALGTANEDLPPVLVYKTPTCGCCNGWIAHLEAAGFTVDAQDLRDLMAIKRDAQVPLQMSSCHTAIVDGYVVEGHVPVEQVRRLLEERPEVLGIAVPGMPIGSPGMEGPNPQRYQVLSFSADGTAEVFAEIDPR